MASPGDSGVKVKNLREITKALKSVGVPNDAIKKAGKDSAQLVVNEAKSLVPVRTGALRNSIRIGATARSKITISAGNNRKSGSGVPYANPIHWGWFKRNIRPQPFFSEALGYTRDEIYRNYFSQIDKLIKAEYAKAKIT
jgi:HK97 gp10 family phage protein